MATESRITPAFKRYPKYRPVNRGVERVFYSGMAFLLCVCVFIGFSPTYYQAGMINAPLPSTILHIHGAVFTLWMLLFVLQVAFISAYRVKWHRTFGTIAFCLPPLMVLLGVIAAVDALHRGVRIGTLDPSVSAAIPLIAMVASLSSSTLLGLACPAQARRTQTPNTNRYDMPRRRRLRPLSLGSYRAAARCRTFDRRRHYAFSPSHL